MMNFRRARLVAFMGLAACGGSDKGETSIDAPAEPQDAPVDSPKVFMDAPPPSFDFSCMGNAAPTAGPATITLSGNVQELDLQGTTPSSTPIDTATIALCRGRTNCGANGFIQSVGSDAAGDFSHSGVDNQAELPFDVHLRMTKAGERTTYVFPPAPFIADQAGIPILSFGSGLMSALTLACGQNDATNAVIALVATDCTGAPITDTTNVHITIKQGGSAVNSVSVLDLGNVVSQFAGTFFVCNVPAANTTDAGATTISATYKTMALKDIVVRIAAGATTQTIVRPGY